MLGAAEEVRLPVLCATVPADVPVDVEVKAEVVLGVVLEEAEATAARRRLSLCDLGSARWGWCRCLR